jgi:hypothetical protein
MYSRTSLICNLLPLPGRIGWDRMDTAMVSNDKEVAHLGFKLVEVKFAGPNLTLLVTQPGAGALVNRAIEESAWEEIEGTVAGLNSVLVLTHDAFFQQLFSMRLQGYLRDGDILGDTKGIGWRVTRKFT